MKTEAPIAGHEYFLNPTALVACGEKVFALDELYHKNGTAVELQLSGGTNLHIKVGQHQRVRTCMTTSNNPTRNTLLHVAYAG